MLNACISVVLALSAMTVGRVAIESPDDARTAHLSWPKLIRTEQGTLIVAYSAGVGHNVGGSGVAVSRSQDDGETFTSPSVLKYFPDDDATYRDCGNVALGQASDGSIVLLAMAYRGDQANTILGWRSTDEGRSWKPTDTAKLANNTTGSVDGSVLLVPDLGLVVFGHYRAPSEPATGLWMATSRDHGQSWSEPQAITNTAYYEPAFTYSQGRFVGLLRLPPGQDRRYDQAVSDDHGKTWTITPSPLAMPEGEAGRLPSPFITVSPDDPKRLYALQSIRDLKGELRGRVDLWSADVTKLDWTRERTVLEIPANARGLDDWSYPWMAALDPEKWLLVYYAGARRGANRIYADVLTIKND